MQRIYPDHLLRYAATILKSPQRLEKRARNYMSMRDLWIQQETVNGTPPDILATKADFMDKLMADYIERICPPNQHQTTHEMTPIRSKVQNMMERYSPDV